MCEGYVRDFGHPSHRQTPLYKGFSEENVRDDGFLVLILVNSLWVSEIFTNFVALKT